jgi:hypothetical protein
MRRQWMPLTDSYPMDLGTGTCLCSATAVRRPSWSCHCPGLRKATCPAKLHALMDTCAMNNATGLACVAQISRSLSTGLRL